MITGFAKEDEQSFETIKSMEKNLSKDKYFEEECPLNERSSDTFEVVTTQEEILVNEEEEDQSEELICETTVDIVEHFDL